MPFNLVPVPGGPFVLVSSNGYEDHFLAVFDVSQSAVVQKVPIQEGWLGLAVSADGRHVYASGGSQNRILLFDFGDGHLTSAGEITLPADTFPAGLTLNRAGTRLYAAANTADALLEIDVGENKVLASYPVGLRPYTCVLSHDEKLAYVSNWGEDSVSLVDLEDGKTVAEIKVADGPNDLAERVNDFETPAERIYCRKIVQVCGRLADFPAG